MWLRVLIDRHTPAQRDSIYQAIRDGSPLFAKGDGYEAPWPAVLASAGKEWKRLRGAREGEYHISDFHTSA